METFSTEAYTMSIMQFKSYYVVWKLNINNMEREHSNSFKSYYVVWKLFFVSTSRNRQNCLNRTMQYGNEGEANIETLPYIMFKSYYVVWKLFSDIRIFRLFFLFKSYYVVWKRKNHADRETKNNSLNRTMQYGNFSCIPFYFVVIICLNRTMQYGNEQNKDKEKKTNISFKSYYVVWKRGSSKEISDW